MDWTSIVPILNHFCYTWADNKGEYKHLLGLFALMLQQPYTKSGVAICVGRDEETGKSMPFVDVLGKIMGSHLFAHLQNMSNVTGEFTSTMTDKLLVLVDECLFAGNNKDVNIIKNFITGDTDHISEIYHNPIYKESFKNFAFNSNNYWFVAAGSNARRYFVLQSRLDDLFGYFKKSGFFQQNMAISYFNWLSQTLSAEENKGLKTFANFLYNLPIDHFEQRNILITRLLITQKQQTLDPFKKYWLDILCMKSQLTVYDPTTNSDVPTKWLSEVDLTKMFSQYHHKVGKAKYAAKTPLEYWTLLQTEVPSSIRLVHCTNI